MKVYVIMGNDYPNAVFANETAAKTFVEAKMADPKNRHDPLIPISGHLIYWRFYEFELQE